MEIQILNTQVPIIPGRPQPLDVQQRAVVKALQELQALPVAGGLLTDEFTTPAGANTDFLVAHKLGKASVEFMTVSPNAAGIIYRSPNASPDPGKYLNLRCSAASVKTKLFVF